MILLCPFIYLNKFIFSSICKTPFSGAIYIPNSWRFKCSTGFSDFHLFKGFIWVSGKMMGTQPNTIKEHKNVSCSIFLALKQQSKFMQLCKGNTGELNISSAFSQFVSIPSLLDPCIPITPLDTVLSWFSFSRKPDFYRNTTVGKQYFCILLNKQALELCFHFRNLFSILKVRRLLDLMEFVYIRVSVAT